MSPTTTSAPSPHLLHPRGGGDSSISTCSEKREERGYQKKKRRRGGGDDPVSFSGKQKPERPFQGVKHK